MLGAVSAPRMDLVALYMSDVVYTSYAMSAYLDLPVLAALTASLALLM